MDEFQKIKNEREKIVKDYKERYKEESKKRLQGIVEKKIQTSFIGALSSFEEFFGFLWGNDKYPLTEEQKELLEVLQKQGFNVDYFYDIWQNARTNALNNGNSQIRAIRQEFVNYTINWERYIPTFPVIPQNEPKEDTNG
jgi:hypothetical protein